LLPTTTAIMKTIVATFLSSILFYTDNYAQKHSSSSYPKSRSFYTKQLMDSDAVLLLSLKNLFMITAEIANRLVTMCRDGKIEEAKEELFAPDIMSIEGLLPKETTGMQAIRNKAQYLFRMQNIFSDKKFQNR
jgi:hypothetical protein